jgi:tellurite resistance protein TerC
MFVNEIMLWVVFNIFVFVMLGLDLGVFHRKNRPVKLREALIWSVFWIILALTFDVLIWFSMGAVKASEFLTGYSIERTLSVDNLFVFILIFSYFSIPQQFQHKVLFWGIFSAIAMRGVFIITGTALLQTIHWSIYLFGGFLVFVGAKMAFEDGEKQINPEKNIVIRLLKKFMPVTNDMEGRFFIKQREHRLATPLFVALLVIESTDLLFAMDSVPAVVAITYDPFIAYTSNVFAILGLRALYFALAEIKDLFTDLRFGIAIILVFVGMKMGLSDIYKVPVDIVLYFIAGILSISILTSILRRRKHQLIHLQ